MLNARWRDQTLGSGSDAWKFWAERCAGNLCDQDWKDIENSIARSPGHCMTMGTASTMTAIAETLGLTLPGLLHSGDALRTLKTCHRNGTVDRRDGLEESLPS